MSAGLLRFLPESGILQPEQCACLERSSGQATFVAPLVLNTPGVASHLHTSLQ